jgi:hypothetical protein
MTKQRTRSPIRAGDAVSEHEGDADSASARSGGALNAKSPLP